MSNDDSFQLVAFLIGGGGVMLWNSLKNKKRARRFEDVQSISLSSAPQGHVEINGFAWAEALDYGVESRGGVFLEWQLEKLVSRNKSSEWVTVAQGKRPNGFLVGDETSAAWVDMSKGELDCKQTHVLWKKASPAQRKIFQSWIGVVAGENFPPSDSFFTTSYRVGIKSLALGCPIVVHGNLTTSSSAKTLSVLKGFGVFKEKYLKLKRNSAYQATMLDVNNDGDVCEDEHRTGHTYAANSLARKSQLDLDPLTNLVEEVPLVGVIKSTVSETVLVANTHEKYYVNRLRSASTLGILGGAAAIAAGVCLLVYEVTQR